MALTPFRWGLIGPGRIAHRFAQALEAVEGARLLAVASRSAERAQTFAAEYGAESAYDTYEALARDRRVDAVYIATPHRFHYDQARLCLEAGKPVLCEKPLTVNAAQAVDLIQRARSRNLFLMEATWTRFLPIYAEVRRWLDAGEIGDPAYVASTFCFLAPRDPLDRKFNPDLAGGALLDLGVYNVSLTQWALRRDPTEVSALADIGDTGVDEQTSAILTYPGMAMAQFTCGLRFEAANEMDIHGPRGSIRIHDGFWRSTRATLTVGERAIQVTQPFRRNGFEYQIEASMGCIRDGRLECEGNPLADTQATLETLDRIRQRIDLRYSFE